MSSEAPQIRPAAPGAPAATAAPAPRRPGLVLAVIATAQLVIIIDVTVVNVALPHIQAARRIVSLRPAQIAAAKAAVAWARPTPSLPGPMGL